MSTIPIRDVINAARSSHPAALYDIATTADLWLADSPPSPTQMTADERAELVGVMLTHAKENHPAALFRLGCCFFYGEVLPVDLTAAQKCWYNAYELLEARLGGMMGLILNQPDDRMGIRLKDKCARQIQAAHDHLRTEGRTLLGGLQRGQLFDLSEHLPESL